MLNCGNVLARVFFENIQFISLIELPHRASTKATSSPLDEPIPTNSEPPIAFIQQAQDNVIASTSDTVTNPDNLDEIIKKRLETLKQDRLTNRNMKTSDTDIAIRIANLKGLDYKPAGNTADPSLLLSTDQRTDQEKIQDLVKQFMAETNLDDAVDPIRDIEKRLAILKGTNLDSNTATAANENSNSEDDDDTKVKKLVSKYLDEAALPVAAGGSEGTEPATLSSEEKEYLDSMDVTKQQDELPWCTICNEDADLRYEGDLFCKACYKEIKEDE